MTWRRKTFPYTFEIGQGKRILCFERPWKSSDNSSHLPGIFCPGVKIWKNKLPSADTLIGRLNYISLRWSTLQTSIAREINLSSPWIEPSVAKMWHMLSLFTQLPSVNWYIELEICVWCDWMWCWGEGFLVKAPATSYLPLRNTWEAEEEPGLGGCPLGLGPSLRHRHPFEDSKQWTAPH